MGNILERNLSHEDLNTITDGKILPSVIQWNNFEIIQKQTINVETTPYNKEKANIT